MEASGLCMTQSNGGRITKEADRQKFLANRTLLIKPGRRGGNRVVQDVVVDAFLDATGFTASDGTVFAPLASDIVLTCLRGPTDMFLAAAKDRYPSEVVHPGRVYCDAMKARSSTRPNVMSTNRSNGSAILLDIT
jgi:hypothetical protein